MYVYISSHSGGVLFNYVSRARLIAAFLIAFGVSNIVTPYIGNFMIFSVITVFKMMCAGGTDCGTNAWILEIWPGKDAWLQALHFTFAVGCAFGPLIVEPFLSADQRELEHLMALNGKTSGAATINDQYGESRIHIPFAVCGSSSILAALLIFYLHLLSERRKNQDAKLRAKQQAAAGENILAVTGAQHPAAIEAGCCSDQLELNELEGQERDNSGAIATVSAIQQANHIQEPLHITATPDHNKKQVENLNPSSLKNPNPADKGHQESSKPLLPQIPPLVPSEKIKFTSKVKESPDGKTPYYVMIAVALAAMSLSFYCGIEITSMNYLTSFAVNIDLQLPKSTGALMTSALTISFTVGRGFGILAAAHMKPHKLFYTCAFIMVTGEFLMLIFTNNETLLWFSICFFGIGCGPMFPAIVSFFDYKISKVTNLISGIFIAGSMFNVALNTLIIGHHIIDNALILLFCNLIGSICLLILFGTLHMLTKLKTNQRVRKYKLNQQRLLNQVQAASQATTL